MGEEDERRRIEKEKVLGLIYTEEIGGSRTWR